MNFLNKSENSVAILLAVSILSMSYPYGFPLFGILTVAFVALKIITGKFKIRLNLGFILFFICILFYFLGMAFSKGMIYSNNISDITNIISFLLIWVLLSDLKREDYPLLLTNFAKLAVFVSLIVSAISLYKFYKLIDGVYLQQFVINDFYPTGTSLVRDYNMFSLAMIAGLIMSVFLLSKATKITHVFYYLFSFMVIFSSVAFAGSRRAWVVAVIIALFLLYKLLKSLSRFQKNFVKYFKVTTVTSFVALFIFLSLTLFNVDINFQYSAQAEVLKHRLETLRVDQASESFSPRTDRWAYATELYEESNLLQFALGQGFDYLPQYAYKYSPHLQEDYPHNPFLSALLYSGLLGVIFLIAFLLHSIIRAIKNVKLTGIYFVFLYFVSYLFVLVSSNSIFSINIFIPLLLLITSIPYENRIKNPL